MHMKTSKVLALALALLLVLGCCSVALADGQYTITYAIYGQAGVYTTQTVTEGDPLGTLPAGPTVAGKVFVRWFRMEGANRVTVDASYVPTGDMTILAEMEDAPAPKTYTITYAIYGQTGQYTQQTVTAGDPLGTLPAAPTVAGKVFVRWFRMEGANRVTVDASYVPTGDMTILAEMAGSDSVGPIQIITAAEKQLMFFPDRDTDIDPVIEHMNAILQMILIPNGIRQFSLVIVTICTISVVCAQSV